MKHYHNSEINVTWSGYACFLIELPFGARKTRVLFDLVFSDRCSPTQFLDAKRYTEPPCKIEDITKSMLMSSVSLLSDLGAADVTASTTVMTRICRPIQPRCMLAY